MLGTLLALVLPLGLDTFAVAAALGMAGVRPGHRLRITGLFTACEAGMPLVGLALGVPLSHAIGGVAEFVAIAVLFAFGLYTLLGPERDEADQLRGLDQLGGRGLLLLGLGISLDELAVGFSLGLLRLPPGLVIALIAGQAVIMTQLGLRLGVRVGEATREGVERLAGVTLTALAATLLAEKLLA